MKPCKATTAPHRGPNRGVGPVQLSRAACALAAAFALLLGLAAPAAQAQTPVKLVGNTGVSGSTDSANFERERAVSFTTGSDVSGYEATRVDLSLRTTATTPPTLSVSIHSDSSSTCGTGIASCPGTSLGALTTTTALTATFALVQFTSDAGIDLDPDTTYWVVVEPSTADSSTRTQHRANTAEDSDGATGWSIGDTHSHRVVGSSANWSIGGTGVGPLVIAIHGHVKPPAITGAAVDGRTLTVTFNKALKASATPSASTFRLRVTSPAVRSVQGGLATKVGISGAVVTVPLPSAILSGETVRLFYSGITTANPLQDEAGNPVDDVSGAGVSVTNNSPADAAGPTLVAGMISGSTVHLFFNEYLDWQEPASESAFTVTPSTLGAVLSAVVSEADNNVITLRTANAVSASDTATVTFTSASNIEDEAGNAAPAVTSPFTLINRDAATAPGADPSVITAVVNGATLTLTYGQQLLPRWPLPADFALSTSVTSPAPTVTRVAITPGASRSTVTLTLTKPVQQGETVTVSYNKANAPRIQNLFGRQAGSLSDQAVANYTGFHPPELSGAVVAGSTLALLYDKALDESSEPAVGDFAVTVAGSARDVSAVEVSGAAVFLTLVAPAVTAGQAVTVDYTKGANPIRDTRFEAKGLSGQAVRNAESDSAKPRLRSLTVQGAVVTLTYDELIDPDHKPKTIYVQQDLVEVNVTAIRVVGRTMLLDLAEEVADDLTVEVNYDLSREDAVDRIQDFAGNWAARITLQKAVHGPPGSAARPPPGGTNPPGGDTGGGDTGGGDTGGGGGGGGGGDQRPEVLAELEARGVSLGAALTLDLSESFRAPGGGALEFTATSSDPDVAEAAVDGDTLTVRGRAVGEAEVAVTATDGEGESITRRFTVTVTVPEAAWYLPPASDPLLQGFVRVVNRSGQAGEATVTATDDAGVGREPLALALGPHQARHFNSGDLENGNPAKGLTGATGAGTGGWRLEFGSDTLDVEALALLRTRDGFVTAMGATAPKGDDGLLRLATFNPASNWRQVSRLRLVNPTDREAEATVTGVDDAGGSPGGPVALTLPAGSACEVDATALETGRGLACGAPQAGLGDGTGKWRLAIGSDAPLVAMSLLRSPTGHLTNLSGGAAADADGTWHVPLFLPASDPEGRQGFVRVINRSGRDGAVTVRAFDDTDFDYEPLSLRLGAGEAAQFNADDLEVGNAAKGLTGSTGPGRGAWRLELSSADIDFAAYAYVRHRDGFLTAMQAAAPSMPAEEPSAGRAHRVATLNPGSNWRQTGVLRLVNRGSRDATATVTGADDRGVRPGGPVEVRVPAGMAVELTAAELESGDAQAIASGALGDGAGKWRLRVASEGHLAAMGLLRSPMGHLSNLSRSGPFGALPALLPPPSSVAAEPAGDGRLRAEWAEVPGARYDVALLRDGAPLEDRSLRATARRDYRWFGLEPGAYSVRVRSVDADGVAGPWGEPSNEVVID